MLRCCAFIAALILAGFTTFQACADRRVAFVIGNSEYQEIPALKNPDKLIRMNDVQYLVWDAFSASRSKFFSARMLRYADRYHGRRVFSVTMPAKTADGRTTRKPIITVYEVRP